MKRMVLLVGMLLATLLTVTLGNSALPIHSKRGLSLWKRGYFDLCRREPEECQDHQAPVAYIEYKDWWLVKELFQKHKSVFKYKSDKELYGRREHWAVGGATGDCEDFAIGFRRLVVSFAGISPGAVSLEVVQVIPDPKENLHVVAGLKLKVPSGRIVTYIADVAESKRHLYPQHRMAYKRLEYTCPSGWCQAQKPRKVWRIPQKN
jgi:predicted transglutaminase-like cysteine proteinase